LRFELLSKLWIAQKNNGAFVGSRFRGFSAC
jgi:hypothetical protein